MKIFTVVVFILTYVLMIALPAKCDPIDTVIRLTAEG